MPDNIESPIAIGSKSQSNKGKSENRTNENSPANIILDEDIEKYNPLQDVASSNYGNYCAMNISEGKLFYPNNNEAD